MMPLVDKLLNLIYLSFQRVIEKNPASLTMSLFLLSGAMFMVAAFQYNRLWAAWSYASNPEYYQLVDFQITSARSGGLKQCDDVKGWIGDQEVETRVERTGLPREVFRKIEKSEMQSYRTKVLYAPVYDDFGPNGPGASTRHVVEATVEGTTKQAVLLEFACWNLPFAIGVISTVASKLFSVTLRRRYDELHELKEEQHRRRGKRAERLRSEARQRRRQAEEAERNHRSKGRARKRRK